MKVKKESKKIGLKLNIQKTKIMASHTTTSWQIVGETLETVTIGFICFLMCSEVSHSNNTAINSDVIDKMFHLMIFSPFY